MAELLYVKALILGVVEGLTEFLPISSTGHLIVAGALLDFNDEKGKIFEIVIQCGAIFAVCWEFRRRIGSVIAGIGRVPSANRLVLNLVIAFIPLAALGLLFGKFIKSHLFRAETVAITSILGAFVIFAVERWYRRPPSRARIDSVDDLRPLDALKIGIAQAFALVPGTSRSGATIIGGLMFGLSRKAATEFSFFLAIPTLLIASAYQVVKERALFSSADLGWMSAGVVAAFVSAFFCVRWLLRYISTHDFTPFAWYRIVFGIVVLWTAYAGIVRWQ